MALDADSLGPAIRDALLAAREAAGPVPTDPALLANYWLGIWGAGIATAVIAHIQANATIVIKTSDGGLQRDPGFGNPTLAPASNKTLPAGCIQ